MQLPFTSINYGTCTLTEGRMVTRSILEGSIKGVGKFHKTPVFPCGIFQVKKGIDRKPEDPNYDLFRLALKSTSQRLYPNYANCDVKMQDDWIEYDRKNKKAIIDALTKEEYETLLNIIKQDDELREFLMLEIVEDENGVDQIKVSQDQLSIELFSTMGCRTQNGADIWAIDSYYNNIHNVIEGKPLYDNVRSAAAKDGRGNICPVTIILPTLAMEAKEKASILDPEGNNGLFKVFMAILEQAIEDAKDTLIERFNYICSQSSASAKFMYENNTMSGYVPSEGIRSALRHGTLALGQLGLAEALQILFGDDHTNPEIMEYAKQIEQLFKSRCAEYKSRYKLNFGVYYSPAENLCYTAMKKFKAKYGIIPKVSENDYFTNSMHCPVWSELSVFDKIDIESQLTGYSSAGCITYVELDAGIKNNLDALEQIVNYAMDKDISYFAVNVPVDECNDCGYKDDMNDTCIQCGGQHVTHLRRVTGYLTGNYKSAFNLGKQQETEMRVKHVGKME